MTTMKKKGHLVIREAKEEDAHEILELVKQVMREADYFPSTPEEFNITIEEEKAYIKNIALFLVAEVEGKIVGSSTLERGKYGKLSHIAMFGITILKDYCGLGIGSLILEKLLAWCSENAIEKIELEVFEENIPAIGLYKKFGFIVEGRKNRYIKTNGKYQDMLLMAKFL